MKVSSSLPASSGLWSAWHRFVGAVCGWLSRRRPMSSFCGLNWRASSPESEAWSRQRERPVQPMPPERRITLLRRENGTVYLVVYRADQQVEAAAACGRWAANPQLDLTWWEAAQMAKRIREVRSPAS